MFQSIVNLGEVPDMAAPIASVRSFDTSVAALSMRTCSSPPSTPLSLWTNVKGTWDVDIGQWTAADVPVRVVRVVERRPQRGA